MSDRMRSKVGSMRKRMNKSMQAAPKFDNQSVGRVFSDISYREHKNPISVRGPSGNTVSLKPRTPQEVGKAFATSIRTKRRNERGD